ncbi:MAG: DUF2461 domain-containing protein [Bacteroidota bacterium]
MASKKDILHFLKDLALNNSKEWMDENRARYHAAKDRWIEEVELVLSRLAEHNPHFGMVSPKQTLSRINNNRRFHPDKPIYKDFFSCEPAGKTRGVSLFYFAIGVSWSFVGGGMHNPDKEQLLAFREAIDRRGEAFDELVRAEDFQTFYGGMTSFQDALKTAPRGYSQDHPYIEYLRLKSITATRDIREKEFLSAAFVDLIEEAYLSFLPMERFLLQHTALPEKI